LRSGRRSSRIGSLRSPVGDHLYCSPQTSVVGLNKCGQDSLFLKPHPWLLRVRSGVGPVRAFRWLSLLPAYPPGCAVCPYPSCSLQRNEYSAFCVAARRSVELRHAGDACHPTPGALALVRVLLSRSIITSLAPSAPLAGTARFRRLAVYTRCLRCAGAPRRPTSGSVLSLRVPSQHAALYDPGEFAGCSRPAP